MTAAPLPAPRPGRRLLWAALVVSLALNLLVAGLVAGWALRRHAWDEGGAPLTLGRLMRDADHAERARVRAVVERGRPDFEARLDRVRGARADVRTAAGAEPFSAERLTAALAALRAAETAAAEARHGALVEIVAGMPPDRRAAAAAALGRWGRP